MRRATTNVVIGLLTLLTLPVSVGATFHVMSISEIGVGVGGNPALEFVELRLDTIGQTQLTNTRVTAFDAEGNATVLVLSDHDVDGGASGANVLYATSAFAAATGVAPDFTIATGIATPTGMICWGAPGASPPAPESWDVTKPENYVDCVAYGGYAQPARNPSGTPSSLPPGNATQSLARTSGTSANGSNDVDFTLATPNVCNNAGECTDLTDGTGDTCGDADGNGTLNVTDGVQALRSAAGLLSACTPARCDIDGDGTITVTDGVQVLRGAAGLPLAGTCTPAS